MNECEVSRSVTERMSRERPRCRTLRAGAAPAIAAVLAAWTAPVALAQPAACNVPVDQDTFISESSPAVNHGAALSLNSREVAGNSDRAAFRFDLSSIPGGSTVTSAVAWLYVQERDITGLPVNVHRITKSWTEMGATWSNLATGFDPTVRGSFAPALQNVFVSVDLTELVQEWVDGAQSNDGMMLQATSVNEQTKITSKEDNQTAQRPCMEVKWTAAATLAIAGTVYEDVDGDADLSDGVGRPQMSVTAFLDGGDGQPSGSDDTPVATVATDINGDYVFSGLAPGTYWIRLNSRALPTIFSIIGGFTKDYLWPEQTFGATGALCDDGSGAIVQRATPGPCYGGRGGAVSDNPVALGTSEHVIRVDLAGTDATDVDFGLSFAVVVHTRDGDDDLTKQRTVQGSLRQFMLNANTLSVANEMRFVPAVPANATGSSGSWWEVTTVAPLPAIVDRQTTLDGTAYDLADGSTVLNPNSAASDNTTGPELVIDAGAGGPGLHVSDAAGTVIRKLGVRAASGAADAGAGILLTGSLVAGSVIERCTIQDNDNSGIRIQSGAAGVQVNGSVIRGNGQADPRSHGIEMDGAIGCVLDDNEIVDNPGSGIALHSNSNNNNTITGNTVEGNGGGGFSPAGIAVLVGDSNSIRDNEISENAGDGILVAKGTGNALIRNSTSANGDLGIDLGPGIGGDGVTLNEAGDGDGGPNQQLNYPVLDYAAIDGPNLIVRGWTRPGTVVQLFASDGDPSGFGEGETFVLSLAEGSGADGDAGVSTYGPGPVNGRVQGSDTTNRFEFVVPAPPGVSVGTDLTATATDLSGNTSEFGGGVTVADAALVADLSLSKTVDDASPPVGQNVVFTLTVSNAGPAAATGVRVSDLLPSGYSYVGHAGAGTYDGVTGIWDVGSVPNAAAVALDITATVNATGDYVNAAEITASGTGDPDSTPGNGVPTEDDYAEASTTPVPVADLSIAKDDGVTSYTPGGSVTYTITISSAGPSDVTGATVEDLVTSLPQVASASWTCTAAGGATCTAGPVAGDIADTVDLPVGGSATYTLVVNLDPGAAGDLVNTATVAAPASASDPDTTDDSAIDTDTQGAPSADLAIKKSDAVASYIPGGSVTYTIVASNAGPSNVTGASVDDAVTSLPQVASASWTCVAAGGATCTAGPVAGDIADTVDLPVGGTATYILVVNLDPGAAGDLVNTATVAAPANASDPDTTDNSAIDTDTQGTASADLAITKDDGVTSYTPGGSVTYTITVSNAGPSDVTGATVEDLVTSLPQVANASWTCVAAGGATCTAGPIAGDIADTVDLPVGGTATYTLVVDLDPGAAGDLVNTATVSPPPGTGDPAIADNSATETDTQGSGIADLSITKSDAVASYTPGGSVNYTIVVSNAGPSDVTGATVGDAVSSLPQVASASWTCVAAGGATCTAGPVAGDIADTVDLPVGGSATYTLVVNLDPGASGDLVNAATVTSPLGTDDPAIADNSATDTDAQGNGIADLSIAKSDAIAGYTPGGSVTYTITASNTGPSSVTGASISDAVTSLPQVASASWTCTAAGGATCTAGPVAGDIADTVDLPVGGSATYTLVVNLDPGASGDLVNTATVTPPAGAGDPVPANNSATDTDTGSGGSGDLAITMNDGVTSYTPGGSVTYTIAVSNAGPSDVNGATVSDAVTALPQVASASWTCAASGGATCTSGPVAGNIADTVNLPVGGTATYTLAVNLDPGASGDLVNTATVTPPAGADDPAPDNNSATDNDTRGAASADLAITKSDGVASYLPGGSVSYTIAVANAGPSAVTGASVSDSVTSLPQVASASWTCAAAGGATCTSGPVAGNIADTVDLPVGATATYTLIVNLDAGAAGDLVNTATVAPPGGASDPDPTDNAATDSDTQDTPTADLSLSLAVDRTKPSVGEKVTFTLRVSNAGPADAPGVAVTDLLPAGYTYAAHSGIGAYDPVTGLWSVGTVARGASATLALTATVNLTGDYMNSASVEASGVADPDSIAGNGVGHGEDDEATLGVTPDGRRLLLLSKAPSKNEVVSGDALTYTVLIRNTVPVAVADVRIADLPPPGFQYVPDSARLNGVPLDDPKGGRPLVFVVGEVAGFDDLDGNGDAGPGEPGYLVLTYRMRVAPGAVPGSHENTAVAWDACCEISREARATVDVRLDPAFDLGLVIGKVFDDRNGDGRQDRDEPGVAAATVALDDGSYAITDDHGRYHFPALLPGQRLLKLDRRSLTPGSSIADPTRVVWLTPGLLANVDFAVRRESEVVSIGKPDELGLSIATRRETPPVVVEGNAETGAVFLNGAPVPLRTTDVGVLFHTLDHTVQLAGSRLEQPIRFELKPDRPDEVEAWEIVVLDAHEREVRRLGGRGTPPPELSWDGELEDGTTVAAGEIYQYQSHVRWNDGGRATSAWRLFGVNRASVIELSLTGEAFESGSDRLSPQAREALAEAARLMHRYPGEKIVIEGHTDSVGSSAYNLDLSRRRATAALNHLVETGGVAHDRFIVRALGETQPIASNDLEEGRELNRRVEIKGQFEEVDRAAVVGAHRTPTRIAIDGEPLELGPVQEFSQPFDADGKTAIEIETSNSQGASASGVVPLPQLEISSPSGEFLVPYGGSSHGCSSDRRGRDGAGSTAPRSSCRVEGSISADDSLEIDGKPVTVDRSGRFGVEVPLAVGRNAHHFLVRNPQGYSRVATLEIHVSDEDVEGQRVTVERGVPGLSVELPPAGAKLLSSTLRVSGATDPANRVQVNGKSLAVDAAGRFADGIELPAGASTLVIRVTDPDDRSGTIERQVEVARNQLFLLAFADAKLTQLHADGALEGSGIDEDGDLFADGRLAFYLKGRIAGKYLITSTLDTGKDRAEYLFRDLDVEENVRLLHNLDPDKLYPVYGDSSTVVYDAESEGDFYLAVDSDEIHGVVGNFPLALTDTELATYQRTLYGARFDYVSASRTRFDEPDTEVVVFANQVKHAHVRDELRATGGSLYYLSQGDVVEGSEQVTLVVRDKNTGLILSREVQRQNLDYTIRYDEGRLMFQRPLSSVVEGGSLVDRDILSGNPVSVQVDYETRVGGFDKTGYGARVRRQIGDRVALGATHVQDEPESGTYELTGFDAEVRLGEGTRLVAEHATSSGSDSLTYVSDDGGLSFAPSASIEKQEGAAWKIAADVDIGEWFGKANRYRVRAYAKELDAEFASSGNGAEQGTRKIGVNADLELTKRDSVHVRHDREERLGTPAAGAVQETDVTSLRWQRRYDRWGVVTEYFDTDRRDTAGKSLDDATFAAARVWWKPFARLATRLDHQETLSGASNDRTTVGVRYQALPWLALDGSATVGEIGESAQAGVVATHNGGEIYLNRRLADDKASRRETTVLGARSPLGPSSKVYAEYQWEEADGGGQLVSLVGMQRQWDPGPGLRFVLSGETSSVEARAGDVRRTAVGTSVSYAPTEKLKTITRNSVRLDNGSANRLQLVSFTQVDYSINDDLTALGKYRYSSSRDRDTDEDEARLEERSVGLAYRPTRNDRFNALFRYTLLDDQRPVQVVGRAEQQSWEVFSIDAAFRITGRFESVSKVALRSLAERIDAQPAYESDSQLLIQRLNVLVRKPIDVGLEYRILRDTTGDSARRGWLTEGAWRLHDNFRVGVGFNFTEFSDDLFSDNDYSVRGWFLRVQGIY